MRLTNTLRSAFVRAAMSDVPEIDYQAATIKLVMEDAVKQLPPKILAVYKDKTLSPFIHTEGHYFGNAYVQVPCIRKEFRLSETALKEVNRLKDLDAAQSASRGALKNKLEAVVNSVTTRKGLLEALPEFEKYLPADNAAACRTVPAIANVLTDFVKAGWPKDALKMPGKEVKKAA